MTGEVKPSLKSERMIEGKQFKDRRCLTAVLASALLALPLFAQAGLQETHVRPRKVVPEKNRSAQTTPAEIISQTERVSQQQQAQSVDDDEVIRVNSLEVLLPVTVRDSEGRFVASLTKDDFIVREDGRAQSLSDLTLRQVPVDVVLMVDASSSVAASFDDFRRAADEFAARLDAEDRFCLIKFDDKIELLQDWTRSRTQLRRALRRLTTGVFTRFHDALYLAAREQFAQEQRRRAIVLISDGIDSGRGRASLDTSLRALLESQVAVYAIGNTKIERARKERELDALLSGGDASVRFNQLRIGDLRESIRILDMSEKKLAQMTSATGGRFYAPESFDALDSVYAEVAEELRHQYALYYTPLNDARDGSFRRITVETMNPTHRTTTRIGYFAPKK